MHHLIYRFVLLLAHAFMNFIALTIIMEIDVTGSWVSVMLFAIFVIVSLIFLVQHIISFIQILKNNTT